MKCPYVLIDPGRKICRQMIKQGLDGELDDFDVTHYCEGNPNHCFFFRFYNNRTQVTRKTEENEPNAPIVSTGSIVLNEATQPNQPSSEKSDKLFKLRRFFRRVA